MSFFENTRKPEGFGGEIMVAMMNFGHRALARWGMRFLTLPADGKVLDCGCGGGANIKKLLEKCPQGVVKGIDYSPVSVAKARELNEQAVNDGRCVIWQGSVEQIIFAKDWFDAVTAFETVYFWPNLHRCFREVYRVLKPGGTFLICNECSGDTDKDDKWTRKIEDMRLGRKDATDEEVLAAAHLANCDEFAEKLPDKWNTNIGENGCALSGGERQRISIARAFLKDAPIILLDEATASLDVENETLIQTALSRLIQNKTVLIIAHQMRTVAGADKIVVLSDGVVAEQGSPKELYEKTGIYTHMADLQTKGQAWTI